MAVITHAGEDQVAWDLEGSVPQIEYASAKAEYGWTKAKIPVHL